MAEIAGHVVALAPKHDDTVVTTTVTAVPTAFVAPCQADHGSLHQRPSRFLELLLVVLVVLFYWIARSSNVHEGNHSIEFLWYLGSHVYLLDMSWIWILNLDLH